MDDVEKLLTTILSEIEKVLNTRSVVGDPIEVEGNTVIPLSSIGFAFGGGGGSGRNSEGNDGSGGGGGGGGGIKPLAVVVIGSDGVRVEPIRRGFAALEKAVGAAIEGRRGGRKEAAKD